MGSSVPAIPGAAGGQGASIVTTPQTGAPAKSAVEQASDAARAAIATQGSAINPVGQPRVAAGHPQGGQFTPSTVKEVGAAAAAAANAAPNGGRGPQIAAEAGLNGEAPVDPSALPAGDETDEGEQGEHEQPGGEGEEGEEQVESELTVLLPGREGDEEYEFTVETPEAAERLRQLKNGYLRGNEVRELTERAELAMLEVEQVRETVNVDPVGFAFEALGDNPDALEHLALSIITQPEMWARLAPKLDKIVRDPNERRVVTAEQKAMRGEFRETMHTRIEESRAVRSNLQEVQATCAAMLPDSMSAEQQQVAFADMLRDLKAYADRHDLLTIPVQEIPLLLARRLTALGVNPVEAAQKAASVATRASNGFRPARPAARPASGRPAPNGARQPAPVTGKSFKASAQRRKAAAIPSGGAGSPSGGSALEAPRNADGSVMSTQEALAWHRARLARGIKTLGTA